VSLEELVKDNDKVKALAHEILNKPHFLAMFLQLCVRPRCPKELMKTHLVITVAKHKPKPGVCRELKYISRPTIFSTIKKLMEVGLIGPMEVFLDKRKKYYVLTGLGRQVKSEVTFIIKNWLEHQMAISLGTIDELTNIIEKTLKVPAEYVVSVLDPDFLRRLIRKRP